MKLISASLTTAQILNETKTVTRRVGWLKAKAGDLLQVVKKSQGLKKGEKVERLKIIRLIEVKREPLSAITQAEVVAEGFPHLTPAEFVDFFCKSHKGINPHSLITVLRFEYLKEFLYEPLA